MSFNERTTAAIAQAKVITDAIKAPWTGDAALEYYAAKLGYAPGDGDKRKWLNGYISNEISRAVCQDYSDEIEYKKLRKAWGRKQTQTIRRDVARRGACE